MTKLLIAFATMVALVGPADAASLKRMPAEYVGNWCEEEGGDVTLYQRADHCKPGFSSFVVHPTSFERVDIIRCQVTKVGEVHIRSIGARPVWSQCTHLIKGWKEPYRSSFWRVGEKLAVHWYEPPDSPLGQ
jgi:hypothetical protein